MTDKEKLEVIEAFVKKGQEAIEIKLACGFHHLSGKWGLEGLISRLSGGDIFRVKPTPHCWQNLIDFIKKGDFKGKKGVRFGKQDTVLQQFLFDNGFGWLEAKNQKIEVDDFSELVFDKIYQMQNYTPCASDYKNWIYYNPDLCQFVEEKPVLVPWTREDVPPVCWIRSIGEIKSHGFCLIICVYADGLETKEVFRNWETLLNDYEYSTDLKKWHPCGKEGK